MKKNTHPENKPLAVITGASSGIGYELAKVFAKNNYNLIVAAEDPGIVEAGAEFRQLGALVESVRVDLSSYDGVERLAAKIKAAGQPIDAICLNAGVGVCGSFLENDLQEELNLIQLNVISQVHLAKRVLPLMVDQDHGHIMFTSSIAAEMPGPYYAVYAASKSFLQSFAEAIRIELKDTQVTVTALQPGPTDTNFFERADMMSTKAGQGKKDDPAKVAQDGFDAMMAGRDHVVAGSFKNKIQVGVAKLISEKQGAAMQGAQTKPGSGI
jgi:short-subunit dehydrogenase